MRRRSRWTSSIIIAGTSGHLQEQLATRAAAFEGGMRSGGLGKRKLRIDRHVELAGTVGRKQVGCAFTNFAGGRYVVGKMGTSEEYGSRFGQIEQGDRFRLPGAGSKAHAQPAALEAM